MDDTDRTPPQGGADAGAPRPAAGTDGRTNSREAAPPPKPPEKGRPGEPGEGAGLELPPAPPPSDPRPRATP